MKDTPEFRYTTFRTPAGAFSLAVDASGAVAATAFGDSRALRKRMRGGTLVRDERAAAAARAQVQAWFKGRRRGFSARLAAEGTPFQRRVWAEIARIPFGETLTYGEVARKVGSSARAVGRASATNPICLIVPCHRVMGADGSLTGFAFGNATKRRLLDFEGAPVRG
ncbi:MAG TPA: methylated-DNA--[protein]-cysteine S-methyltransferase [Opitutaceae bacterium]|nr:methylated-DNA--[protein]-cysteine S-methyltransferase [Opitutaceae bacterium]